MTYPILSEHVVYGVMNLKMYNVIEYNLVFLCVFFSIIKLLPFTYFATLVISGSFYRTYFRMIFFNCTKHKYFTKRLFFKYVCIQMAT